MPAVQTEVIQVNASNAEAEAARMIDAIPVAQGLEIQSAALGDTFGIWRDAEDTFDLFFRGSMLRGSGVLAKRALARFLDIENRRMLAIATIQEAFDKAHGIAPVMAANDAYGLKNQGDPRA